MITNFCNRSASELFYFGMSTSRDLFEKDETNAACFLFGIVHSREYDDSKICYNFPRKLGLARNIYIN